MNLLPIVPRYKENLSNIVFASHNCKTEEVYDGLAVQPLGLLAIPSDTFRLFMPERAFDAMGLNLDSKLYYGCVSDKVFPRAICNTLLTQPFILFVL